MEAVILQPLGNVDGFDTGALLERPHVENELVRTSPVLIGVQDRVVRLELAKQVIGVE